MSFTCLMFYSYHVQNQPFEFGPPARVEYQPKQEPLRVHQPLYQYKMPLLPPQSNPPKGAVGGIQVFPAIPLQKTQFNVGPPPVAPQPIAIDQPEKQRIGWNCSVCTFPNEPFSPGCKMCSAPPPERYEPPADYVRSTPVAPKPSAVGQPEKQRTGWNCSVCTFPNEPFSPGCRMCSAPPPVRYEPPADYVRSTPVAPKPSAVGQPEKQRTDWNCSVCTFPNEPFSPGCKMCSAPPPVRYEPPADYVPSTPVAPKPIAIVQPKKQRAGWNCSVCTFLNEAFFPSCKMCSAPPPVGYQPPADHAPIQCSSIPKSPPYGSRDEVY